MARFAAFLLALVAAVAPAQGSVTKTVDFLIPADQENYYGSVINVQNNTTTMAVVCATTADRCGLVGSSITITQGPTTWGYGYNFSNAEDGPLSQDFNCKLDPQSDVASCVAIVTTVVSNVRSAKTQTLSNEYSQYFYPVTVTANADKLGPVPAGATGTAGSKSGSANATSKSGAASSKGNLFLAGAVAVAGAVMAF